MVGVVVIVGAASRSARGGLLSDHRPATATNGILERQPKLDAIVWDVYPQQRDHQRYVPSGNGSVPRPVGQKLMKVCGTMQAGTDYSGWFSSPRDYNVDTDAGTAFTMLDNDVNGWSITDAPGPGQSKTSCETWVIPSTAQTVIVAVNNWQTGAQLYKVDLP